MDRMKLKLLILSLLCALSWSFPDTAGSCGPPVGIHGANSGATSVSGSFSIVAATTAAQTKSVVISGGSFEGYLVQAYHGVNGRLIGEFTPPSGGMHYKGCFSNPKASLCQSKEADTNGLNLAWKGSAEESAHVQFVAYLVVDEDAYYTVKTAPSSQTAMPKEPCRVYTAVAFPIAGSFVVLVVLAIALTCVPALYPLRCKLTQSRPIGVKGAYGQAVGGKGGIVMYAVHFLTFGFFREIAEMTWNEAIVIAVFMAGQVVALVGAFAHISGLSTVASDLSRAVGSLAVVNFSVLLLPISRTGLWVRLCGWSFERAIKYHRILGRYTILQAFAHGYKMFSDYGMGEVLANTPTCWGAGNRAGVLANVCFAIVALFSVFDELRRRQFELFFYSHFLAFIGYFFAIQHINWMLPALALPGALYVIDRIMRAGRSCGKAELLSIRALPGKVTRLELKTPQWARLSHHDPGPYMFLMIPQISRLQWHPISLSSPHPVDAAAPSSSAVVPAGNGGASWGDGSTITFHIKVMGTGQWSDKLYALAAAGDAAAVTVHLDGPHGSLEVRLHKYETIVCVGGGIGVTPMASVLGWFILRAAAATGADSGGAPRRCIFIWSVPSHQELGWMSDTLSRAAACANVELRLFVTRWKPGADGAPPPDVEGASEELQPLFAAANSGRPKYGDIFAGIQGSTGPGSGVAVLACGPPPMVLSAQAAAQKCGFHFHKETFLF